MTLQILNILNLEIQDFKIQNFAYQLLKRFKILINSPGFGLPNIENANIGN